MPDSLLRTFFRSVFARSCPPPPGSSPGIAPGSDGINEPRASASGAIRIACVSAPGSAGGYNSSPSPAPASAFNPASASGRNSLSLFEGEGRVRVEAISFSRRSQITTSKTPTPGVPAVTPPEGAAGLSDSRIAAVLPSELLQPGEIIILLLKPSLWFILLQPLRSLIILGALAILGLWACRNGHLQLGPSDVVLIAFFLISARIFWQVLEWLSHVYVLTDRRILRVRGVVHVHVFEAPLTRIQHTNLTFAPLERLFGLGSIHFATAGTAFIEASWQMLAHPLDVHQKVVQALNRYR
ncbi:MAG: PH domain-containing protein [Phycisphaeraceae bacterium]|nr:PH domain-containing protein [Phycisphaeraceae bacterium]